LKSRRPRFADPDTAPASFKEAGTIIHSGRRSSSCRGEIQMAGEDIKGPNKLDQAKEAVQAATQTVKETTQSVADAVEAGRQPGAPLDRLARWAQEAPLHAVAVRFWSVFCLGAAATDLANVSIGTPVNYGRVHEL
jgi:hypothetical protein